MTIWRMVTDLQKKNRSLQHDDSQKTFLCAGSKYVPEFDPENTVMTAKTWLQKIELGAANKLTDAT